MYDRMAERKVCALTRDRPELDTLVEPAHNADAGRPVRS